MTRTGSFTKMAAIASSILLAGALVAYRAGAFDWLIGRTARDQVMLGSKMRQLTAQEGPDPTVAPIVMSGSKVAAPLVPQTPPSTQSP